MEGVDFSHIIEAYERTLTEHGCTAAGVQWISAATQRRRFEVISALFDGPFTVNDYACGYGAFFEFASSRLLMARYVGIDATPAMVAAARQLIVDPRATFMCDTTVSTTADYTIASGAFGLPGSNGRPQWQAWIREELRNMWNHSRRGIAFNILDARAADQPEGFFFADGDEFAQWCRDSLSPHVELLTPPGANDWTILVRRNDLRSSSR